MSKEKITKKDIKHAVEKAFYDTLEEDGRRLTADQVAEAFERSDLQYHFDSQTATITIIVDGNSRIECIWNGRMYEIRPSMTYNSLTPAPSTDLDYWYRDFFFRSFQLPAMIGFFRNFANRLIEAKKEFDNQTKNIILGDVLKAMIKPLLRKEKIFKVKYLIGDDDGSLIMYKDFLNTVRLSVVLTSDNYETRIHEFGEANRVMSAIIDRDDAEAFLKNISGVERSENIKLTNPRKSQEPYATEMRYPEGIELIDFEHIEISTDNEYADFGRLLDELKYNWGWIPKNSNWGSDKVVVQINNNLVFWIDDSFIDGYYDIRFVPEIKYAYGEHWNHLEKTAAFYILNMLATQVPDDDLAELSFSDGVVYKVMSMIADRTLTFSHSNIKHCYRDDIFQNVMYIGTKAKDCFFRFRIDERNMFSTLNYLNENYEHYLELANTIAKYPGINLRAIKK